VEGDYFAPFGSLGFPDDERAIAVSKENKEEIAKRIEAKEGVLCASLVGYDTVVVDEFSQAEMEKLGITGDVFSLKSMPELSSRGGMRPLWVNAVGLKVEKTETEKTDSVVSLSFSLPSGAYATVAVEQLIGN
jgi:tRNA(Glu) U13 pseudouridine synthase TruD